MRKFLSALQRKLPKRLVPVFAVVAAIAVPVAIMAWGPSRATYTVANPANKVVFNSIIDNPHIGDERNFTVVRDAAITTDGGWQDNQTVQPGKEYTVRMYVHNNAHQDLNLKALNTRVKAAVPTNTAKNISVSGFVSASNADPTEVWDDIHFNSAQDFNLVYVPGSAEIYNNATGPTGKKLSDSIVTSAGAPVSYTEEGVIPGCFKYASYVYFKVKPQFASTATFEMSKTVRKLGDADKTWKETVATQPGDKVEYRVKYTNKSGAVQNNVVVKDVLPAGVSYVNGSTKLYTTLNPNGVAVSDNVTKGGINIGSYQNESTAYVIFTAQVAGNDQLPTCGPNTLKNVAKVETDHGTKEDDANVTVPKECKPPEAKVVCKGLEVKTISRTQFTFKGSKEVTNAEFVKYVYAVKNSKGETVKTIESTNENAVAYENSTVGKYTVQVSVVAKVNGQEVTKTDDKCKGAFEVVEKPVESTYKCDALTLVKLENRTDATFKAKAIATGNAKVKEYKIDFGDGQSKVFGVGAETQTHTYAPGKYTAKLYVSFEVDGQLVPNQTGEACQAQVNVEQPPVVPPTPENPETPELPKELPATGPEAVFAGLLGSSALGFGINAYVRSRRNLAGLRK
ncbi:MAG TPA: PKD domain-containing protein [Candidatus Saccharimonadales bacterium]